MVLDDRSDLLERLAGLKAQKPAAHYPEEKEAALAALTGINSSKLGYYRELKSKVHELEASNEQLREAKRVADDLYRQSVLQAERLDRALASLKSISQVLTTTTRGVGVLLQSVVRTAAQLFDTEYAVMTVGVPGGAEQVAYCAYGLPSSSFPAVAPRRLLDLINAAARERRPVTDPPVVDGGRPVTLCVPMFRDDLLMGNLCLQFREGRDFAESDLSILQTLASQAAVAIENARLFEESQRLQVSTRQLYEMAQEQKNQAEKRTRELTLARDELTLMQQEQLLNEERNRIARELHDSVAQILISIGLNLEWCRQQVGEDSPAHEKLLSLKELARSGVNEIRSSIFQLWSIEIFDIGMMPALERMAREFQRITGIEVELASSGEVIRLPLHVETAIYRVAQEACNNVFKHARASRVKLEVAYQPGAVVLQVTDDGIGIADTSIDHHRQGPTYGVKIMLARVEQIGGSLEISNLSQSGGGTRVTARVPLKEI